MNISRFTMSHLHNEEWFRFHTEHHGLATGYGTTTLKIDRIFSPYDTLYDEADVLLEILRKSFITADTTAADQHRVLSFRALRDVVKSNLNVGSAAEQAAASKVHDVIRKYADTIQKGSLPAKTAATDNLLQDLTDVSGGINLSKEVQTLGIGKWVNSLNEANQAYKTAMAERNKETSERPEAGRMKQVRIIMDHHYTAMINIIDAYLLVIGDNPEPGGGGGGLVPAQFSDEEMIVKFAKELNACVARYKALLKKRETLGDKNPNQTPDPEDDEDIDNDGGIE